MREALSFLLNTNQEDQALPEMGEGVPFSDAHFNGFQSKKGCVGYVDGGSAVLLEAPSFLLERIRVVGVVLDQGKRVYSKKEEYEINIRLVDLNWVVSCSPNHAVSGLKIHIRDPRLREGQHQVPVTKAGGLVRRLMELDFLARFTEETSASVFVLDGSLEAGTLMEREYLKKLEDKPCVGLSKTSKSLTKNGEDVASSLLRKKEGVWWYHPIATGNEKEDTAFIKLHEKSEYVFRLDFWKKASLAEIVPLLGGESQDPVFIGYPYGLVIADQWARVTNEEKAFWQLQMKVEAGKHWNRIAERIHSLDAHSILDKIR